LRSVKLQPTVFLHNGAANNSAESDSDDGSDASSTGSTVDKLADEVYSLRQLVSVLLKSNEALMAEVTELRKDLRPLRAPVKYSDAVKRNLPPKQLQEVALVRRAFREEKGADERAKSLIMKEEIDADKKECAASVEKMLEKADVIVKQFCRLGKDGKSRLVRLTFPSAEEAKRCMRASAELRAKEKMPFSLRRDMSQTELTAYRRSWKEDSRRSNAAGKKIWTVPGFEMVKLDVAEEWQVREPIVHKKINPVPSKTESSLPSHDAPTAVPVASSN